jgi:hypothetical protein
MCVKSRNREDVMWGSVQQHVAMLCAWINMILGCVKTWVVAETAIGNVLDDAPPSSLCDPKRVQRVGFAEMVRNSVSLPASSTKRGRGVVLEAPGLD